MEIQTNEVIDNVRQWGIEKGIIGENAKATLETQFEKLLEEVEEVRDGIQNRNAMEIFDGIGDCTVVLILLAELAGTSFESCLDLAYGEIKNRTGVMKDGVFVKDSKEDDLDEPLGEPQALTDEVCESCS